VSDAPAVEVEDLTVRYGRTTAVDGVSFVAARGQVTALLGPNGAGKTSILEHLEGYRPRAGGSARVLGLDPRTDHAALVRVVGLMLQDGGIPLGVRPRELLAQYAGFFDDAADPDELLARVGLSHRARTAARRLSGGERQRLSLALALVGRPQVVFLDEPTSGIDQEGRTLVREVVDQLTDDGVAVVLTTHDLDEGQRMADRVVIVDHGRVVADGTTAELLSSTDGDEILFAAPDGLDTTSLGAAVGGAVDVVGPGEYRARVAPSPANVAALTAWLAARDLPLGDLRAGRQRLDDVFRRLTSSTGAPDMADEGRRGRRSRRSR